MRIPSLRRARQIPNRSLSCISASASAFTCTALPVAFIAAFHPVMQWQQKHQLARAGKTKEYHEEVVSLGVKEAVADPQVEAFAFQEMNKSSGASHCRPSAGAHDRPLWLFLLGPPLEL